MLFSLDFAMTSRVPCFKESCTSARPRALASRENEIQGHTSAEYAGGFGSTAWKGIFMNRKNESTFKARRHRAGGAVFALLLLTGLAMAAPLRVDNAPATARQKLTRYELKGVVKFVDRPNRSATIKHEKVGDYMGPMTMPFLIKDEKALNTMRPGDQIQATLVVTDDGGQCRRTSLSGRKPARTKTRAI
jgi:Cu/Ag efflux protein CusF